jgi:hypothetical protein
MRFRRPAGVGLRGGTFHAAFGDTGATVDLSTTRFAADVFVTGHAIHPWDSEAIDATIQVNGPDSHDGDLRVPASGTPLGPPHSHSAAPSRGAECRCRSQPHRPCALTLMGGERWTRDHRHPPTTCAPTLPFDASLAPEVTELR